jgi:hypothetical protein
LDIVGLTKQKVMAEIEEEVKEEVKEPKKLEDIIKRYGDSQNEMMHVLVNIFVKLETLEKKRDSPILNKLLN